MQAIHNHPKTLSATLHAAVTTAGILAKASKCAQCAIDFFAALFKAAPKCIPIIKSAIATCGNLLVLFQFFNSIDAGIKLKKNARSLKISRAKLNRWSSRCGLQTQNALNSNDPQDFKKTFQAIWLKQGGLLTPRQQEKLNILMESCATVTAHWNDKHQPITGYDAAQAYVNVKCHKWQTKVRVLKIEKIRFILTIACDISEIAFTILGLAATLGIFALTTSSLPLLFLGLVVASLVVSKKIYKSLQKNSCNTPQLCDLEAAIVHEYKQNKLSHKFNCLQHCCLCYKI